jgi:hypothetical protein
MRELQPKSRNVSIRNMSSFGSFEQSFQSDGMYE